MEVTLKDLMACLVDVGSTIAEWDGGFSLTRGLEPSAPAVDYAIVEGWIEMSAPIASVGARPDLARALLRRNAETGPVRYALRESGIVLRGDYPTHNFDREEFVRLNDALWSELAASAEVVS